MASYAQVAARNSQQTAEEASAPAPQTIVPNESLGSDAASYTTNASIDDSTSSSSGGPGGVHVINQSELSELNTSDEQVIEEGGPSITLDKPVVHDETGAFRPTQGQKESRTEEIKEKLTGKKKFSPKEKQVAVFGGVGTLNLLALGAVGYWGWRRYSSGENGWKILGIAAGTWVGLSALEWITVRYAFL